MAKLVELAKNMEKISSKKLKIAVAMSGGIDSSVSALLLKKRGFAVSGFFLKFWSDPACGIKRENSCCDSESLKKAKEVAKKLGMPIHIVDVEKIFKKTIVDNFIDEFKKLRTPNPCVGCNKFIKFGWFLDLTQKLGFDKIATGHYARIKKDKAGIFHLLCGKDRDKDQSYFLCQLNQKHLSKIIFPVGSLAKKEVIKIAKKNKLNFENKKESQEICFISDKKYGDFLKRHISQKYFQSGKIVDLGKNVVGKHSGLINYTIGQRKGIDQTGVKNQNKTLLYVAGFEEKENTLIAGSEKDIYRKSMRVKKINWISKAAEKKALSMENIKVKIRYRHVPASCSIKGAEIKLKKPQWAITPGQYAVFYLKDEVLGGGVIS